MEKEKYAGTEGKGFSHSKKAEEEAFLLQHGLSEVVHAEPELQQSPTSTAAAGSEALPGAVLDGIRAQAL
ncbi:hypothetical protein niasHT_003662 [Heterodera trifolii]|uniref:Uncharacterized protein n=1 Tax=Heterodera trifolii TaxID=157864 RepID=A0ABD2MBA4_9BILA